MITPDDPVYETARPTVYRNPSTDRRPALIARCATTDDIRRSLELVQQHDLPLAVRSGGHSFVGWGTCDGGLVIDTSPLQTIEVDPEARTARAAGGVLAESLVAAAVPHRLVPALGECPTVGISGLTLGGGVGWLSGRHGATCDTVLGADLVDARGNVVHASAEENPELFWALRGGGGNFGVVTSFTYRLFPLPEVTTGTLGYRFEDAPRVLRLFFDLMSEAPDALQALAALDLREGERGLRILLCWSGEAAAGEAAIAPLRAVAIPERDTVRRAAYEDTFELYRGGTPMPYGKLEGVYIAEHSDDVIEAALERLARAPGPRQSIGFDHYMHGEVCRVPADATAFELRAPHASHVWVSAHWNEPTEAVAGIDWLEDTWSALRSFSGGRTHANYPSEPGGEGERTVRTVYARGYERLAAVKREYDPDNLFRRNYNIRPSRT